MRRTAVPVLLMFILPLSGCEPANPNDADKLPATSAPGFPQSCASGTRVIEAFRYDMTAGCVQRKPEPVACTAASPGGTGDVVCVQHLPSKLVFRGGSGSDFKGPEWRACEETLGIAVIGAPTCP